jgi:hypothetical protein
MVLYFTILQVGRIGIAMMETQATSKPGASRERPGQGKLKCNSHEGFSMSQVVIENPQRQHFPSTALALEEQIRGGGSNLQVYRSLNRWNACAQTDSAAKAGAVKAPIVDCFPFAVCPLWDRLRNVGNSTQRTFFANNPQSCIRQAGDV